VSRAPTTTQPLDFPTFLTAFETGAKQLGIAWKAVGFLGLDGRVYPFGTDTKVISTVFETIAAPLIHSIAEQHGYLVESSDQTIYPDFTLSPNPPGRRRIAIDIKTTYRRFTSHGKTRPFRFTLGSYMSFLRDANATKNIKYPYAEYSDHWIIGFLYTRSTGVPAKVYTRSEAAVLPCPYEDVEYFIQEKYKIVGERPGSGNTTNIGSFETDNIADLREGCGPFAALGKAACDDYWRNYAKVRAKRLYSNCTAFLEWRKNTPLP
jgi:hypothetical protein